MFKRLQDRFTSAVNTWAESDLQRLQALGFSHSQASAALQHNNGNVDRAAEYLLNHNNNTSRGSSAAQPIDLVDDDQDAQLQQVLEQSRREEEERRQRPQRTAAMHRAAQAALARHEPPKKKKPKASKPSPSTKTSAQSVTTQPSNHHNNSNTFGTKTRQAAILRDYHPKVKMIPKLQDKSTEEQILRTADRLRTYPNAVDLLLKALKALQRHPENAKFRQIDTHSVGYQKHLQHAVGSTDFLRAMQFTNTGTYWRITAAAVDPALLYLGISALEQTQHTPEYQTTKRNIEFQRTIHTLLTTNAQEPEEVSKRQAFGQLLPREPKQTGALVTVQLSLLSSDNANSDKNHVVRRRFDGDDTVQDVLHWLGTFHSEIVHRLTLQEWQLMDCNRHPVSAINVSKKSSHLTLQYIGCWPSGRLALRPKEEDSQQAQASTSRGLASRDSSDDE